MKVPLRKKMKNISHYKSFNYAKYFASMILMLNLVERNQMGKLASA